MPDQLLDLTIGPPAHGGHCVARHDGRVVFVRHTLPGERVRARVTEATSRYWRADATEVLEPSPDRVPSVWPEAGPGGVGGGELAHVALPAQRAWKRDVITDALRRIGHIGPDHAAVASLQVEYVPLPEGPSPVPGTGYRTRVTLIADGEGRAGMHGHRSDAVLGVGSLPLAHARIHELDLLGRTWPAGARIQAVAPSVGAPVVLVDGRPSEARSRGRRTAGNTDRPARVREVVRTGEQTYTYRVSADGFWQAHAGAPAALVAEVLRAAELRPGQRVLELYSGSGLFSAPLAAAVGAQGRVDAVEGAAGAVRDARRNAHGLDQIHLHDADVRRFVTGQAQAGGDDGRADVVVLDPPRSGAGEEVMRALVATGPERVVYVACDPAALARDAAAARDAGYELASLTAFDLYSHTHHVECVAVLAPGA
ncbi:class I SAM-dependent RNA methyltransferase [Pseudactinotalea sp. Z1748]|uniref:class I SAM-dependent RNA methyltransferase n=1 Tax=Pseudactinotalea sp. Z1748 TaxID=3413027 RepID=UPI003C7ABF76